MVQVESWVKLDELDVGPGQGLRSGFVAAPRG